MLKQVAGFASLARLQHKFDDGLSEVQIDAFNVLLGHCDVPEARVATTDLQSFLHLHADRVDLLD